jgi:hypothetical protein
MLDKHIRMNGSNAAGGATQPLENRAG